MRAGDRVASLPGSGKKGKKHADSHSASQGSQRLALKTNAIGIRIAI